MWSFTPAQCAEPQLSTCCLGGSTASNSAHRQRCVGHSGTLRPFQKLQAFRAERRQGTWLSTSRNTTPRKQFGLSQKLRRTPRTWRGAKSSRGGKAAQYRKTAPGLQGRELQGETAGFSPPHHRHQHSPRNPTQEGDDPARGGNQPLPAFHPGKQSTCLPWLLAAEPVPPTQQREPCLAQSLLYPRAGASSPPPQGRRFADGRFLLPPPPPTADTEHLAGPQALQPTPPPSEAAQGPPFGGCHCRSRARADLRGNARANQLFCCL